MNKTVNKLINEIKDANFNNWSVSFWLIKRKISVSKSKKESIYLTLRVDMDDKLPKRFKGYLKTQLQNQNRKYHLENYDYSNADGDGVLLTMDSDDTDFTKVESEISKGLDNDRVSSYSDLLNSWAYVILFESGNKKLYAWKKISADTQPKKAKAKNSVFFYNQILVDLDDKDVFAVYPNYDFFVYKGTIFISSKGQFESSMNFREGIKAKSNQLLKELKELEIFQNIELIDEHIGDNLHYLRKMASILKSGYYKQPNYINKLIAINKKENWQLKVENGKIIVEKETIDLLLKLLNNDRLRSLINDEIFDAVVKSKVN
ncbi:Kiwa anti-phage protein KwaB-like domain-containing protein [Treponema phagedenis]|uniref:DUF4868 domain-containing protein n=1 Tax=Treponema phagedenis TaxID=162 RepID=A0AAE6M8X6_TREPH|nr:Kiwa anti-phage protein KwaB-like domain-containing protein [Treponema phagedenis]NVP22885.1 DUF4868 domain-containing protein [Treponema phagedenis]QEJ94959.1 DUF4868 domain-containing protein [Treponema phagedenis]QEJ98312.1 DUF4868 domain-containing protein [Treponema phagedenis]QEK00862.1 DUF4868 domain-containing protein [Treponema phagedenis]QEK03822.1 DUF4868 domain-containing protein [Treponema phagedenis]